MWWRIRYANPVKRVSTVRMELIYYLVVKACGLHQLQVSVRNVHVWMDITAIRVQQLILAVSRVHHPILARKYVYITIVLVVHAHKEPMQIQVEALAYHAIAIMVIIVRVEYKPAISHHLDIVRQLQDFKFVRVVVILRQAECLLVCRVTVQRERRVSIQETHVLIVIPVLELVLMEHKHHAYLDTMEMGL